MSILGSVQESVYNLRTTRFRRVFAVLASIKLSIERATPVWVGIDRDGDWVGRQSSASFFSSQYNKVPTDDEARDIWEHYWPIQAGELLIDVGAGIGEHVVCLSRRVGPGGKVIAIEAHPGTFRCLEKTIAASGLANVVARQLALSDSEGQVTMEDEAGYVSNRIGAGSLTVTACTLDSLLDGLNGAVPSVVKMNIEGAETAALRGATRALQAVPRWIVSCHDFKAHQPGCADQATLADVRAIFTAAGFVIRPMREDPQPWLRYYVYAERADLAGPN